MVVEVIWVADFKLNLQIFHLIYKVMGHASNNNGTYFYTEFFKKKTNKRLTFFVTSYFIVRSIRLYLCFYMLCSCMLFKCFVLHLKGAVVVWCLNGPEMRFLMLLLQQYLHHVHP